MESDLALRDLVGVQDAILLEDFRSEEVFIDNLEKRFKETLIYDHSIADMDVNAKLHSESQKISQWKLEKEFEIQTLSRQLEDSREDAVKTNQRLQHYQESHARIQSQLNEERQNKEELTAKVHHCKCIASVLETQMKDAYAMLEKAQEQAEFYKNRHEMMNSRVDEYAEKLQQYKTSVSRLQLRFSQQVQEVQSAAARAVQEAARKAEELVREKSVEANDRVKEAMGKVQTAVEEKERSERENRQIKGELSSVETKLQELTARIESLQDEMNGLREKERIAEYESQRTKALIRDRDIEIQNLQAQIARQAEDYAEVKREAENLLLCLEAASRENQELTSQNQANQVIISSLKADVEEERQKRQKSEEVRDDIAEAKQSVEDQLSAAFEENAGLTSKLHKVVAHIDHLENELKNQRDQKVRDRTRIDQLEETVAVKDRQEAEQSLNLQDLSKQLESLQSEVAAKQAEIMQFRGLDAELEIERRKRLESEEMWKETALMKQTVEADLEVERRKNRESEEMWKEMKHSVEGDLEVERQKRLQSEGMCKEIAEMKQTVEDQLAAALQENLSMNSRLESAISEKVRLHEELAKLNEEVTRSRDQLRQLEKATLSKDGLLAAYKLKVEEVVNDAKAECVTTDKEIAELKSTVSAFKEKVSDLEEDLKRSGEINAELVGKTKELERELFKAEQAKLRDLLKKSKEMDAMKTTLSAEIQKLKVENENIKTKRAEEVVVVTAQKANVAVANSMSSVPSSSPFAHRPLPAAPTKENSDRRRPAREAALKAKPYYDQDDEDSLDSTTTMVARSTAAYGRQASSVKESQQSVASSEIAMPEKPGHTKKFFTQRSNESSFRGKASAGGSVLKKMSPGQVIAASASKNATAYPDVSTGKRKLFPKRQDTFSDDECAGASETALSSSKNENQTKASARSMYDYPNGDLFDSPPREKTIRKPMKGFRIIEKKRGFVPLSRSKKDKNSDLFDELTK